MPPTYSIFSVTYARTIYAGTWMLPTFRLLSVTTIQLFIQVTRSHYLCRDVKVTYTQALELPTIQLFTQAPECTYVEALERYLLPH